jgi:hypothetical protein
MRLSSLSDCGKLETQPDLSFWSLADRITHNLQCFNLWDEGLSGTKAKTISGTN